MDASLSQQELSDLIGRIYDCALDPGLWEDALSGVKDALHCETAVLHLNDLRNNRMLLGKWVGIEPSLQKKVAAHLPEMHGWLAMHLGARRSLDEPLVVSRDLGRAEIAASPYIRECGAPYGLVDTIEHFLMMTPTRLAGLGMARHERQGILSERDIETGRRLLPHLRRAVTISDVLHAKTIEAERLTDALDALKLGVVLANEQSGIVYANRAAESLMSDGGPLRGARQRLHAERPAASSELRSAIAAAARNEAEIGRTGLAVRLTGENEPPLIAHVLPLANGRVRTRVEPRAVAAIFIAAPIEEAGCAAAIASAYRLTPAEARVLAPILAGRTVPEAATDIGVATTTARTHLNSIFAKTGVCRQSDLIRLAASIAPATS